MAFGGLGNIAGGIYIQAMSIRPAGQYVAVSQNGRPISGGSNIFWRKNGPNEVVPGIEDQNNNALQYISIAAIDDDVDAVFLAACDADATDSEGTLTTEAPTPANAMHSLPANFGYPLRSQNRWEPGDEDYINVWFRLPQVCQAGTGTFGIMSPQVAAVTFVQNGTSVNEAGVALGNIRITIINIGLAAIPTGTFPPPSPMVPEDVAPVMNVEFMHSIQR